MNYFRAAGIGQDIHASDVLSVIGVEPIRGGQHVGPYTGRLNHYAQRHRIPLRVVPGEGPNTYRLVSL